MVRNQTQSYRDYTSSYITLMCLLNYVVTRFRKNKPSDLLILMQFHRSISLIEVYVSVGSVNGTGGHIYCRVR